MSSTASFSTATKTPQDCRRKARIEAGGQVVVVRASVTLLAHEHQLDRRVAGVLADQSVQAEQNHARQAAVQDNRVRAKPAEDRLRFCHIWRHPRGDLALAQRRIILFESFGVRPDDQHLDRPVRRRPWLLHLLLLASRQPGRVPFVARRTKRPRRSRVGLSACSSASASVTSTSDGTASDSAVTIITVPGS